MFFNLFGRNSAPYEIFMPNSNIKIEFAPDEKVLDTPPRLDTPLNIKDFFVYIRLLVISKLVTCYYSEIRGNFIKLRKITFFL